MSTIYSIVPRHPRKKERNIKIHMNNTNSERKLKKNTKPSVRNEHGSTTQNTKKNKRAQKYITTKQIEQQCKLYKKIDDLLRESNRNQDEQEHTQVHDDKEKDREIKCKKKQIELKFPVITKAKYSTNEMEKLRNREIKSIIKKAKKENNVRVQFVANENKYDEQWIGEKLHKKDPGVVRCWLQNPNGIKTNKKFASFRGDLEMFKQLEVDMIAMPESRLNRYNGFVNENMKYIIEQHFPGGYINIANTPGFGQAYAKQNGGVTAIVINKLANKYAGQGQDRGGRYNWISFRGKNGFLKIYTLYRVNKSEERRAGMTSAWTEQFIWLTRQQQQHCHKLTKIDPRQAVIDDILKNITSDIKKGDHVIVMGDINETIYGNFNEEMRKYGLQNVIDKFVLRSKGIRSQERGSTIIDGVWATPMPYKSIIKLGLAPFYTGFTSDHRGIYFDLNCDQMFENYSKELLPAPYRRLKSTIPKRAKKYTNTLLAMWKHHKMERKVDAILEMEQEQWDKDTLQTTLNKIDMEIGRIMKVAEKGCCMVGRQDVYDWSPTLANIIKKERKLRQTLKKKSKCCKEDVTETKIKEIFTIKGELQNIRKEMKTIIKDSESIRIEHIKSMAEEKIRLNPLKIYENEMKTLLHVEEQRKLASVLKRAYKSNGKRGIDHILIPSADSYEDEEKDDDFDHFNMNTIWQKVNQGNWKDIKSWERIDERDIMESMLTECMRRHFNQAHGTPLTTKKWKKRLQDKNFVENLREGNLSILEGEMESIQKYFTTMSEDGKQEVVEPIQYTFDQWSQYIKSVKEKTTTSPDGRHFGHYKTLMQYAPAIFEQIFTIMNIAIRNNIVLDRWKRTVTILIEKHEGKPYIHRTRPLHIVEPEVNAIAKLVWAKTLMKEAEMENKINEDQYGGRRGRQAQSAVLNKVMYYNINAQTLTETQYDDDDLRSNYDREMVHLVLTEAAVKHGMHETNTDFVRQFIKTQEFFIQTANGISQKGYKDEENYPLYGMGQGLAWSGPAWILMSNTICNAKKKSCKGMFFQDPLNGEVIHKCQDMFVDDLASGTNYSSANVTVMQQGRKNLQEHVNLVNVTGGDIALEKCWFYHVDWEFENGAAVAKAMDGSKILRIKDPSTGSIIQISQLDVDDEHKTLGCFVNPLGINVKAYDQLMGFAKDWRGRTMASNLRPEQVLHAYETMLITKIIYRLPVYSLTYEQCEEIMKVLRPTVLNSMRLQNKFPTAIMEANQEYMGLDIAHLYDLMGIEKIKFLLMHIRRNDVTGKLLMISMKYTQLEVGSEKKFFNLDYDQWGHLCTWTWMTHLWEYMSNGGMQLQIVESIQYNKQRQNDQYIMDVLKKSGVCSGRELKMFNKVRQHFKVLLLSDMADMRGNQIRPEYFKKDFNAMDTNLFFRKQKPTKYMISIWRRKALPIIGEWLFKHRLANWIAKPHQKGLWRLSIDRRWISNGSISFMQGTKDERRYYKCNRVQQIKNLNTNGQYVDVRKSNGGLRITAKSLYAPNRNKDERKEVETRCERMYKKIWGKIQMTDVLSTNAIYDLIQQGQVIGATDGGLQDKRCAQAWCLAEKQNGNILVKGHGPVYNMPCDASSLRPEMYGILSAISYANHIIQKHGEDEDTLPPFTVYTDSEISILNSRKTFFPTTKNVLENNIDIKLQLAMMMKKSVPQVVLRHVKAHQDQNTTWDKMDIPTRLNVKMDEYVNQYFKFTMKTLPHRRKTDFLPAQKINIALRNDRPTSAIRERLKNFRNGHKAETYIKHKMNIKDTTMRKINWEAIKITYSSYTKAMRAKVTKAVYEQWHTMKVAHRCGLSDKDVCPCCATDIESWLHVLQCQERYRRVHCKEQLLIIKQKLLQAKTHPVMTNRIMAALHQITGGHEVTIPNNSYQNINMMERAFMEQKEIGFENMLKGFVTNTFQRVQERYYETEKLNSRLYNGARWSKIFLTSLHRFLIQMWKYRCDFVKGMEIDTIEIRVKQRATMLMQRLRERPWLLLQQDQHLLGDNMIFDKSDTRHIENWQTRVEQSMLENMHRKEKHQGDIRKYLCSNSK